MDKIFHDLLRALSVARQKKKEAEQEEDGIITKLAIHMEEVNNGNIRKNRNGKNS